MEASVRSATPVTALSPEQFAGVGGNQPPVSPAAALAPVDTDGPIVELSVGDRTTLERALAALKSARKDLANSDPKIAHSGRMRLVSLVGYLTGFFDSRWAGWAAPVNSGFEGLSGASARPALGPALDEFEEALAKMLAAAQTRSVAGHIIGSTLSALGDVAIGLGAGMVVASLVI